MPVPRPPAERLRAAAPPAAGALWALALGFFADLVLRSYTLDRTIGDFDILHQGAVRLLEGRSVYADPLFLLTPSGLAVVAPFGLGEAHPAFLTWNTLSVLASLVGVACTARFAGAAVTGPVGAALLLGLALSESLTSTLLLGNLNNSLLLALGSAYLLAERRDRRVLAGVLLGLALAVKPVLLLVLLVPLLRRRWSTLGWAVAVPAVSNLVGLALVPQRGDFLDVTVPGLLEARSTANSSIWAVGTSLGLPGWAVALLRVLVLLVALAAAWRLRSHPDPVLRLGVGYGLLLLATFLGSSLSQGYYSLLLLPLLVTVVRDGSPVRNPLSWLAVYLFMALDPWPDPRLPQFFADLVVARWTLGWLVLFAVLAAWALAGAGRPRGRDARPDGAPGRPQVAEAEPEPVAT